MADNKKLGWIGTGRMGYPMVERLLKAYLTNRSSADETFLSFARRHDGEALRKLAEAEA